MYNVKWDHGTNGVLLSDTIERHEEIMPPRPVFFEELDLLGFDSYWTYPRPEEPLLWAIERRYFYKGIFVAEARGGTIFDAPEIVLTDAGQNLTLEPVNVPRMILKNQHALDTLTYEAMDFVEDTYKRYNKKKHIHFVVSFSGGKDSQVVLDLVSRVIPPDEYIVIFTDTTMEIPPTYQAVKDAEKLYTERYPDLKFYTARNPIHSHEFWREFGPPSRILRWCCSVYKTAPVIKLVRELYPQTKQPKLIIFDGVRSDESLNRQTYKRIAGAVKHPSQINAEVIKHWNTTEIFLYLFSREIELNEGYKYGLNRVGCNICPFASHWSEFLINKVFPSLSGKYLHLIKEHIKLLGIEDDRHVREYIIQRQWKKRAGGEGVDTKGTRIDFLQEKQDLLIILSNFREDLFEWLKTIGEIIWKFDGSLKVGEIRINGEIVNFEVEYNEKLNRLKFRIKGMQTNNLIYNKIKKVVYKTNYCVHCGACEVECPTQALIVNPHVKINTELCIQCGNCLDFIDRGCLRAKSLAIAEGGTKNMNNTISGFGRYLTFGMREEWVISFFNGLEDWFSNNTLGTKQVDSMVAWLKDAELLEKKQKKTTSLCEKLKNVFLEDKELAWQIIWINLCYSSSVIGWYITKVAWGEVLSTKQMAERVTNEYDNIRERTATSGIKSLTNTLETNTYLSEKLKLGIIEKRKNIRYVKKIGTDYVHPMAIAYFLYKFAEYKDKYAFTVSELYQKEQEGGPYSLFGISQEKFEHMLRWLQENKTDIVRVDLVADLDNIHLQEDITYEEVLTMI